MLFLICNDTLYHNSVHHVLYIYMKDGKLVIGEKMMKYLTFRLRDPDSKVIRCVGVKYKKTKFSQKDLDRIIKNGTANAEVKDWIKVLKQSGKKPELEVLYQGEDSAEACYHKQLHIIKQSNPRVDSAELIDLIGVKISNKRYTKGVRVNSEMRRPIVDQRGVRYAGVLEAAELLCLAPSNISKVLHGKLEHIGGFKFSFLED